MPQDILTGARDIPIILKAYRNVQNKKYQIDMCHGPLFSQIVRFSLPLMATTMLSLLFHAADLVVLGQFAPSESMGAVGATSSLIVLQLIFFYGLSAGVNVLVARYIGAKDPVNTSRTVHTAIALALAAGVAVAIVGIATAGPVLRLMDTPAEVLDGAIIYLAINALGAPAVICYSFGSAILRAMGDTKRPLIYITVAGVVNVLLNLFFVIVFHWDVAGVAIATKLSNLISAILVLRALNQTDGATRLIWRKIRFHAGAMKEILIQGVPAGIQGSMFSIANVIIQSSVNSFGWQAVAGNTAAVSLEAIINVASSAYYQTAISFTGQNSGGKKHKRIIRSIWYCIGCCVFFALLGGWSTCLTSHFWLGLYNPDPEVIRWGALRMNVMMTTYFLCGIMDVIAGSLRGLGHSVLPTVTTLIGVCGGRLIWIFFIFRLFPEHLQWQALLAVYPVSWTLVIFVNGGILFHVCRKMLYQASHQRLFVRSFFPPHVRLH